MDTTLKDSQGVKEKQTASQEVNPTTTTAADAKVFIDFEATEASQEKEKPLKLTSGKKKIENLFVEQLHFLIDVPELVFQHKQKNIL